MNRQTALARSHARISLMELLTEDETHTHDIEAIVTEVVEAGINVMDLGTTELATLIAPHEFTDEDGLTDAKLAAAIKRSVTGWAVMLKTPGGDVEMIKLSNPELKTEGMVRAHLQRYIAPDVDMHIFPHIG